VHRAAGHPRHKRGEVVAFWFGLRGGLGAGVGTGFLSSRYFGLTRDPGSGFAVPLLAGFVALRTGSGKCLVGNGDTGGLIVGTDGVTRQWRCRDYFSE
jgi:hypothetical protein